MNILTTTLSNAIDQIAKSVQLSTVVPSSLFVLVNILFVLPVFGLIEVESISILEYSLIALLIISGSYLLWIANGFLIRTAEGYTFGDSDTGVHWTDRQRKKLAEIDQQIETCQIYQVQATLWLKNVPFMQYDDYDPELSKIPEVEEVKNIRIAWKMREDELQQKRMMLFPQDVEETLPTAIGNRIQAFEQYPMLRYEINSVAVWPRMAPILAKNGFGTYVEREKAAFDFLINLIFITLVLAFEFASIAFFQIQWGYALAAVGALLLVLVFIPLLTENVDDWGTMVQVAFDLYRHDLRRKLLGKEPTSLKEEREIWRSISLFLLKNEAPCDSHLDYSLVGKQGEVTDEKPNGSSREIRNP